MGAQADGRDLPKAREILRTLLKAHLRWDESRLATAAGLQPSTLTRFLGDPRRGTVPSRGLGADAAVSVYDVLKDRRVDARLRDDFLRAVLGTKPRRRRLSEALGVRTAIVGPEQDSSRIPAVGDGHDGGATGTQLIVRDVVSEDLQAWDRWIRKGIEHSGQLEFPQAEVAFRLAETRAPRAARGAQALAMGYRAQIANDTSDFTQAEKLVTNSLILLHAADLPPEEMPSWEGLASRLGDDVHWRAYAQIARLRGRMAQDRRAFPAALAAYETLHRIGLVLGEGALMADAAQRLGTVCVEMGTEATDAQGRILWTVTNPRALERALGEFAEATAQRPVGDELGLAFDYLNEATARDLLSRGLDAEAAQLEFEAAERFGDSPAQVNVLIKQARRAMAMREDKTAVRAFGEAAELAWVIGSRYYFAHAVGALAAVANLSFGHRSFIVDGYAAALVAWPLPIHRRGYERFGRFFDDMRPTSLEIEQAVRRSGSWLAMVAMMPGFEERLRERVWGRLYRRRGSING